MDEQDNVRVDLLKFRRKAFLSYPEGSKERRTFLKTVLSNELRLAQEDVPDEFVNFIVDGKKIVFWSIFKDAVGWLGTALLCGILFPILFIKYRQPLSFILIPIGAVCLAMGLKYFYSYWEYIRSVKIVESYSNGLKKYIDKVSNDIKRLDGPR